MTRIITFGTFDLLHVGHVHLFQEASKLGGELVVGVSSDALNWQKKRSVSIIPEDQRLKIVASVKYVSEVFLETSLDMKREYIERYNASVMVMGSDCRWTQDVIGGPSDGIILTDARPVG